MYNFFPIKEVGDSSENDRPPAYATCHHHLNISGDPPSCQQKNQAHSIPHYYPPYCATEHPEPLSAPMWPIYYSSLLMPLRVGPIYYSLLQPAPYPQHGFPLVPPSYPQHEFIHDVVPPPTGLGYVWFEDEDLPNVTNRELWEIYDKYMATRRAIKRQGKRRRERRMKENKMRKVHSP